MLNLRTLILGLPRTCPQTGLQNEPRYSEKLSEFGTVNWTPYIFVYFYLLIFFQHDKTIRQQILQNCLTIRILSTKKNKGKICKYRLLSVPLHPLFDRKAEGEMLEWLKRHAWKACIRQKRIGGSNPPLSAVIPKDPLKISGSFFLIVD